MQKRTWIRLLAAITTVFAMFAIVLGLSTVARAKAGDTPAHEKKLTSNDDGTYTLELSVTGDADYDAMDFPMPSETGSLGSTSTDLRQNFQLYRRSGNSYTTISDSDEFEGTVYRRTGNWPNYNYSEYTGTRYSSTVTRMSSTKTSVNNLIDTLIGQNTPANPDTIEIALVTFSNGATYATPTSATANNWVSGTNATALKNTVNDIDAEGGTNWDQSLNYARSLAAAKAAAQQDETVYIVFFSDGEPTYHQGSASSATNHNHTGTRGGTGNSTSAADYYSAYNEALQINNASYETELYGIFAFGTEETYMKNVVSYGNYGNGSQAESVAGSLYFNANSPEEIEEAFSKIAESIINAVGITDVSINDGTTNQVATSTGVSELLEVDDSSFEYWLTWNLSAGTSTFKSFIGGKEVECTAEASGDNVVITWDGGTATYEGTITGNVVKVHWTEKTNFYNYDPPEATFNEGTGAVDWDLNSLDTLLNGVTYSVTFTVYPSQETLDDVADILNDPGEDGAWADLDPAVQQYISPEGDLKTNTTATLTYSDTRLDNPGPKTSKFDDPDPVPNSAVKQMAVAKEWDNQLESEWDKPASIVLGVTRDGDPHYTVTLGPNDDPEKDWKGSVYVSIGIMGHDGKPLEGSEGHDFTFTEPELQTGYKWEIDAPVVHPMLIDNVPTYLIKVDDAHTAPEGAATYSFNDATYYVDNETVSLTATNERRSSLNIVKAVDGVDVPEDAVFPFTINVKDSLAPATAPEGDDGHNSDYWIWISIWDKDQQDVTEGAVVSGATHAGGSWYYGVSGQDIVLNVKAGYSIRVNNVPVGTEYTITEGEALPTGFTFDSASAEKTDGDDGGTTWAFTPGQTSTGTIDTTNAVYTVTYTNKYELIDINVDKVWVDGNNQDGIRPNQDGIRPEDLTLTLNGLPEGVTAPDPTIAKDGNTWTYVWKGVPRYDTEGNEIAYTVSEDSVPTGYTVSGSPANDGGTITNTHEPEVTEATVIKSWDDADNQDGKRPTSLTVTLSDGQTVTLSDSNQWTATINNLPKYANGQEIAYTWTEGELPEGYTLTNTDKPPGPRASCPRATP